MVPVTHPDDPITAYTVKHPGRITESIHCWGLTKREYFAAMAMQGFLTAKLEDTEGKMDISTLTARAARIMADALIAELNK